MQVSVNSKMVSESMYNQAVLDNSFLSKYDMTLRKNKVPIREGVAQNDISCINKTVIMGGGGKK